MAANPNSNLVFDFPDPTPRFEFGDSFPSSSSPKTANNAPSKNKKVGGGGKRGGGLVGKFSKKKIGNLGGSGHGNGSSSGSGSGNGNGNSGYDNSPSKASLGSGYRSEGSASGNTAATASLGTSLDSSLGSASSSANNGGSSSPLNPRNLSGDIAAGPSGYGYGSYGGSYGGAPAPHFDIPSSQASPGAPGPKLLNLPPSSPGAAPQHLGPSHPHQRHPSSANSASGYISEVSEQFSEFSFDRVTVTTNETGRTTDSNVSWGFLDDAMIDAGAAAAIGAAGGGQGKMSVPHTGGGLACGAAVPTMPMTRGANNNNEPQKAAGAARRGHRQDMSNGTFDNVSVSDDEMDLIPMTGVVNRGGAVGDSDQSVISEISERTGVALEGGGGDDSDAARVRALLKDGMKNVRRGEATSAAMTKERKVKGAADSSPSRNTHSTARSTRSGMGGDGGGSAGGGGTGGQSSRGSLLGDIRSNYERFKTSRSGGGSKRGGAATLLQTVMEDLEFCGLYFCGIDTTTPHNQDAEANVKPGDVGYDEVMRRRKEERKMDADDNFLGKVIRCGGDGCCGVVEL